MEERRGGGGGSDEGTTWGAPRSKSYHSSLTLLPRKRGISSPWEGWRDGGRLGRRDEENRRTTEAWGGGGVEGRLGDRSKTDQEGKRGRFLIKIRDKTPHQAHPVSAARETFSNVTTQPNNMFKSL